LSQGKQPKTLTINTTTINKKGKGKSITFKNSSKIIKQRLKKEKRYINLSHSLKQASIESRTTIKELSDKEPYIAIKDKQANNKISNANPLTLLKVRPIYYKRYVNRYVALVKKQEALNYIIN
jgi:hypothetical protein